MWANLLGNEWLLYTPAEAVKIDAYYVGGPIYIIKFRMHVSLGGWISTRHKNEHTKMLNAALF